MPSLLQFVDSIAASPTVRLDMNDGSTWKMLDGTEFPPPPLRRAVAQTLLTDGGVIPSSAYDLRTLTLTLGLGTSSADNTATALQNLFRELDRPRNLIRWQPQGVTNPVFFRTFRTEAESVMRHGQPDNRQKTLTVHIPAEYAAYGLLETPVSVVSVSADPAAGSNGCFVDVSGVKGDVESPAIIEWPESAVTEDRQTVIAVRRRGTPSQIPFVFQAEDMIQWDAVIQPNDTAMSGAGNNYSQFTMSGIMLDRVRLTDLGTASADLRGKYRVFARYRKTVAGDDIDLQLRWGDADGNAFILNDEFPTPDTASICMADLGEISVPFGIDSVHDARSGTELAVDDGFRLAVVAGRTSGTGTVDLDFIVLVPVDDRFGLIKWARTATASTHRWLDALDWSIHARSVDDEVVSIEAPKARAGGLPMLSPGQTNRIFALYEVGAGRAHAISTTTTVSVSYYPLYLSVRPAST